MYSLLHLASLVSRPIPSLTLKFFAMCNTGKIMGLGMSSRSSYFVKLCNTYLALSALLHPSIGTFLDAHKTQLHTGFLLDCTEGRL